MCVIAPLCYSVVSVCVCCNNIHHIIAVDAGDLCLQLSLFGFVVGVVQVFVLLAHGGGALLAGDGVGFLLLFSSFVVIDVVCIGFRLLPFLRLLLLPPTSGDRLRLTTTKKEETTTNTWNSNHKHNCVRGCSCSCGCSSPFSCCAGDGGLLCLVGGRGGFFLLLLSFVVIIVFLDDGGGPFLLYFISLLVLVTPSLVLQEATTTKKESNSHNHK